jgi:hypothetical protein
MKHAAKIIALLLLLMASACLVGCLSVSPDSHFAEPQANAVPAAHMAAVPPQAAQVHEAIDEATAIRLAHDYITTLPLGKALAERATYRAQRVESGWSVLVWWSPDYPGGSCHVNIAADGKVIGIKFDYGR